jgi:hypothetical protein
MIIDIILKNGVVDVENPGKHVGITVRLWDYDIENETDITDFDKDGKPVKITKW